MLPLMPLWLHATLCVLIPAVWGVIMYFVFDLLRKRRLTQRRDDDPPPIDYSI
jgi:hypothetical protein